MRQQKIKIYCWNNKQALNKWIEHQNGHKEDIISEMENKTEEYAQDPAPKVKEMKN